MPSAAQLARARQRFASLLPDLATIQRPVTVADGAGGLATTWPVLVSGVPCRLSPVQGGESSAASTGGDRVADEATAIITFAAGQDITEADRIVIAGQTFDITLVRHRGQWELTRRCEARETQA
jgi:head-tail adaptor